MLYIVTNESLCLWSQPGFLLERLVTCTDGMSLYTDGVHRFFMIDSHLELIGKI